MLLNIDSSLRTDSRSCYKRHTWYTEGHKRLVIDRHVPLWLKYMQMMVPIFPKAGGKHLKLIKIESTDYTASHWSWFNICSFQLHRLPKSLSFQTCNLKLLYDENKQKEEISKNRPRPKSFVSISSSQPSYRDARTPGNSTWNAHRQP